MGELILSGKGAKKGQGLHLVVAWDLWGCAVVKVVSRKEEEFRNGQFSLEMVEAWPWVG